MNIYYRNRYLFCLIIIVLVGCSSPATLQQPIWVDVRTPEEYQQGHIKEASNIPHEQIESRIAEVTDNKKAELHLYCGSGRRAEIAKTTLENMGYTNVTNEGGYKQLLER